MQTVAQQLGKQQLRTFEASPRLVTSDAIGIELELEGFSDSARIAAARALGDYWIVERDGSLRNGGVEFITNGGLGGTVLVHAIDTLAEFLSNTPHDVTFRCSTHMHINMLDFTVPQVVKFILTYTALEPYLFSLAGSYRYSSNFCTPVAESVPFHKRILSMMSDEAVRAGAPLRYCNKYTALNISPLFYDPRSNRAMGTLEFRGGRAMTSSEELLKQCNILLSIKKYVREFEGDEEALLNSLSAGVIGTVTSEEVMAGLLVSEDFRERALMNAWALLKSYQEARSVRQSASRGGFPGNSQDLSDIQLLEYLGVTEDNWYKLCRNISLIRNDHSGRVAVQRAISCFHSTDAREAVVGIYQQLHNVRILDASRDLLVQAVHNLRYLVGDTNEEVPRPRLSQNLIDLQQTPLEETLYAFVMKPQQFQALSIYTLGAENATTTDVVNWFITTRVRVKNRDRLNTALRTAGINYMVGEEEQAALVSYMMRNLMLPYEDYVWRADRQTYIRCAHAIDFVRSCRMRVPLTSSVRHLYAFTNHILSGRIYPIGDERNEFLATRTVVENEVNRLAGVVTTFALT